MRGQWFLKSSGLPGHFRALSAIPVTLWSILLNHAPSADVPPILNQSTSNMTFLNGDNSGNRGNSFQILADGTQDLAALVGLFATDGVERYTIDYTRGLLPPVTAPLSLLGLLGYVRALLKLSLGIDFCQRTGFSTVSLRSYAGVRRRDVAAQNERIIEVHYLERTIAESSVQWKVVKTVPHTEESMPLIAEAGKQALRDRRMYDTSYSIAMCSLDRSGSTARLAFGVCALSLMLTASLSSTMTLISDAQWNWTRLFACIGLPTSIIIGGLPWCGVYITEHLPFEPCDWFRSDWRHGTKSMARSTDAPRGSLMRRNSLAYFARDDQFYIFDCRAISVLWLRAIRVASSCAAICITIAYICQYIELRSASAKQSGIWLGIQGALAIVRVLVWDWAPKTLGFSTEADIRGTDQRNKLFEDSLTELEILLCWSSVRNAAMIETDAELKTESNYLYQAPLMPKWLVSKIDGMRLVEAFGLWNRLRAGAAIPSDFHQLRDASVHWDMPDYIFARWLQLRCRTHGHKIAYEASKRRNGIGAWLCRIIQDIDGNLHMIPGISLHVYFKDPKVTLSDEIIFFSHCTRPQLNILCFPRSQTQRLYQGVEALPNDYRGMPWLAQQALEPTYQQIFDELWAELLSALTILGLAGT